MDIWFVIRTIWTLRTSYTFAQSLVLSGERLARRQSVKRYNARNK